MLLSIHIDIDFYTYNTKSNLPNLDQIDAHSVSHLRFRRQTSKDDPLTKPQIPLTNATSTTATMAAATKPADTPTVDGTVAQNGGPPKKTPPSSPKLLAAPTEHTLLGVNGTGQRKDYGPTKPTVVSEPIITDPEENEKKLQILYPATGKGKPIKVTGTPDADEFFEDFDKPDAETNHMATTNNITAFKEVKQKCNL